MEVGKKEGVGKREKNGYHKRFVQQMNDKRFFQTYSCPLYNIVCVCYHLQVAKEKLINSLKRR